MYSRRFSCTPLISDHLCYLLTRLTRAACCRMTQLPCSEHFGQNAVRRAVFPRMQQAMSLWIRFFRLAFRGDLGPLMGPEGAADIVWLT
jgi:hypothetical protein